MLIIIVEGIAPLAQPLKVTQRSLGFLLSFQELYGSHTHYSTTNCWHKHPRGQSWLSPWHCHAMAQLLMLIENEPLAMLTRLYSTSMRRGLGRGRRWWGWGRAWRGWRAGRAGGWRRGEQEGSFRHILQDPLKIISHM